jgi:hypothetical protein
MKIQNRNKKIRSSRLSTRKLAKKYHLSCSRIRQIIQRVDDRNKLSYQKIQKEYSKKVKSLIENNLNQEIKRLSDKGRCKKIIIQKVILIRCLKDVYGFSLHKIARLFKNHHSTIGHLYYFHKDEKNKSIT